MNTVSLVSKDMSQARATTVENAWLSGRKAMGVSVGDGFKLDLLREVCNGVRANDDFRGPGWPRYMLEYIIHVYTDMSPIKIGRERASIP